MLNQENIPAMLEGCGNLWRHLENARKVWQRPVVVAINRFVSDTQAELDTLYKAVAEKGVPVAVCNGWAEGGNGTLELAELVAREAENNKATEPSFTYPDSMSLTEKIEAVARRIYGADGISVSPLAAKQLSTLEKEGYGSMPVCIAKTQYSFSDDAQKINAPTGFTVSIRQARLSAGAGFVVAFAGDIIAMPGLPKRPAALGIDVDENGTISGLF